MASEQAKSLHDRRKAAAAEYKSVLAEAEGRSFTVEERTKLDAIDTELSDLDTRIKSVLDAESRSSETDSAFAELESRAAERGIVNPLGASGLVAAPDLQAWANLGHGHSVVEVNRQTKSQLNLRTLVSTTSAAGGATVPTDFYDQLISYLVEVSGLLQTGPTVLNTAGGETLQIPTVTSHPTAATAAQGGTIPTGDPAFALKTLGAQKFGWSGSIARELIDDTAVDLLGYLAMAAGRALGNTFGSALLLGGNGVTAGLVSAVSGTSAITGAVPSAVTGAASATGQVVGGPSFNNLIDLQYSVIAPYRQSRSCSWLAADQSMGQLRKLTDSVGRQLWQPSPALGVPDMLLGKPLIADPFMPQFATGNPSILFGDFSQYFVRLVGGLRFERSDDFKFDTDLVTFRALLRGDGNLADPHAIRAFIGG